MARGKTIERPIDAELTELTRDLLTAVAHELGGIGGALDLRAAAMASVVPEADLRALPINTRVRIVRSSAVRNGDIGQYVDQTGVVIASDGSRQNTLVKLADREVWCYREELAVLPALQLLSLDTRVTLLRSGLEQVESILESLG